MVLAVWPWMGNCQHRSDIPALAASDPPCITHCGRREEVGTIKDKEQQVPSKIFLT